MTPWTLRARRKVIAPPSFKPPSLFFTWLVMFRKGFGLWRTSNSPLIFRAMNGGEEERKQVATLAINVVRVSPKVAPAAAAANNPMASNNSAAGGGGGSSASTPVVAATSAKSGVPRASFPPGNALTALAEVAAHSPHMPVANPHTTALASMQPLSLSLGAPVPPAAGGSASAGMGSTSTSTSRDSRDPRLEVRAPTFVFDICIFPTRAPHVSPFAVSRSFADFDRVHCWVFRRVFRRRMWRSL